MRATPYHLRLREHLARYKREVLGVAADGTWRYRGEAIPYPHILPVDQQHLNVLGGVRDEFWVYWDYQKRQARRPAKLHRNFAHLTSSQALAFNLFFPFLGSSRAAPEALLGALGVENEPMVDWRFEEVLDQREGTNFDVAMTLASGRRVLVEVKLTERAFGTCTNDAEHRDKLAAVYAPRLVGKVPDDVARAPAFFGRYQILRNVSYADAAATVVFLVPRENVALAEGTAFIRDTVLAAYRPAVQVVYLEDVLAHLTIAQRATPLAAEVAELTAKYVEFPAFRGEC